MRALTVKNHEGGANGLELVEVPLPVPRHGEVLVKVAYAPVNPNDQLALRGAYDVARPVGSVPGFEGSGTVVGGSGVVARLLRGRRVAFAAAESGGSWAEYSTALAMKCVPLRAGVTERQGATMLTNPMTAMAQLDRARREGHRTLVQAAAAGALGTMMARLAPTLGLTMIHLVRDPTQVAYLASHGARYIVDTSSPNYKEELAVLCSRLGATLALDPVGGPLTGELLGVLADRGVVRIYGWLSGQPSSFDPSELIFRGKRLEGFTMYDWLRDTSPLRQFLAVMRAQRLLGGPLATDVRRCAPLGEFSEALAENERPPTPGKLLFSPGAA
jgi:NADPH:quinone reductase